MWQWILPISLGFAIILGVGAGLVALLVPENQRDRRKTAYGIIKLVLGTVSLTAVSTTATRLVEAGLL